MTVEQAMVAAMAEAPWAKAVAALEVAAMAQQ